MSDVIIQVENLSKRYTINHQTGGGYRKFSDALIHAAKAPFRWINLKSAVPSPRSTEEFWALKNVSFEIKQGEVLGIIGRNGAGKSTLLKILSRITEPTSGRVTLKGSVASLLEVGTGFHPELTGRENIYLNGAILGMTKSEIKSKFDEIVAFAEIEKFLDTPVKRYSSGMYVRLAFAVAAHLEPEILITDEVLAVGDVEFQKKCMGKMNEVAKAGRTVLFVSHNMASIQSLCSRVIVLKQGVPSFDGPPLEGTQNYLAHGVTGTTVRRPARTSGEPTLTFACVEMAGTHAEPEVRTTLSITTSRACIVSLELRLHDHLGIPCGLAARGLLDPERPLHLRTGENQYRCSFPATRLARGNYHLTLQIAIPLVTILDLIDSGLDFHLDRPAAPGMQRAMEQSWGYGAHEMPLQVEELPLS